MTLRDSNGRPPRQPRPVHPRATGYVDDGIQRPTPGRTTGNVSNRDLGRVERYVQPKAETYRGGYGHGRHSDRYGGDFGGGWGGAYNGGGNDWGGSVDIPFVGRVRISERGVQISGGRHGHGRGNFRESSSHAREGGINWKPRGTDIEGTRGPGFFANLDGHGSRTLHLGSGSKPDRDKLAYFREHGNTRGYKQRDGYSPPSRYWDDSYDDRRYEEERPAPRREPESSRGRLDPHYRDQSNSLTINEMQARLKDVKDLRDTRDGPVIIMDDGSARWLVMNNRDRTIATNGHAIERARELIAGKARPAPRADVPMRPIAGDERQAPSVVADANGVLSAQQIEQIARNGIDIREFRQLLEANVGPNEPLFTPEGLEALKREVANGKLTSLAKTLAEVTGKPQFEIPLVKDGRLVKGEAALSPFLAAIEEKHAKPNPAAPAAPAPALKPDDSTKVRTELDAIQAAIEPLRPDQNEALAAMLAKAKTAKSWSEVHTIEASLKAGTDFVIEGGNNPRSVKLGADGVAAVKDAYKKITEHVFSVGADGKTARYKPEMKNAFFELMATKLTKLKTPASFQDPSAAAAAGVLIKLAFRSDDAAPPTYKLANAGDVAKALLPLAMRDTAAVDTPNHTQAPQPVLNKSIEV